jgi:hypothetical protein
MLTSAFSGQAFSEEDKPSLPPVVVTVVMVDGIRLSEIDLSNALMSSIPVDSVERIELTQRRQQRLVRQWCDWRHNSYRY